MRIKHFYIEKIGKKVNFFYKSQLGWKLYDFTDQIEELTINSHNSFDGIKIIINNEKKSINIDSSTIGSVHIYSYNYNEFEFLSTDLDYLISKNNLKITYNKSKLLDYFILSYHALDNQTIYNEIKFVPRNTKININDSITYKYDYDEKIFHESNKKVFIDDILQSLIVKTNSLIDNYDINKSVLLLSGGKDSIIGALLARTQIDDINTSTHGFDLLNEDIILGQKRSNLLFKQSKHHRFLFGDFKYDDHLSELYSRKLGGFGPYSSIGFMRHFDYLNTLGYENYFYSCHFECMRKRIVDDKYFELNNTTPRSVVNKYFLDNKLYYTQLELIKEKIKDKYKINPYYQFYFYERHIQGGYYKNILSRNFGFSKFTFANNKDFLNLNFNYLNQNNHFTYQKILKELLKINNIKNSYIINSENFFSKPIPINPMNDIRLIKTKFLYLLAKNSNSQFSEIFNFYNIIQEVKLEKYEQIDCWFLLRLFQILNYKNIINA